MRLLADGHHNLGNLLLEADRLPEAQSAYRRAQDMYEKLANEFPMILGYRFRVGDNIGSLGIALLDTEQRGEAGKLLRASLASTEKLASEFPDAKLYRSALASAHGQLGMAQYRTAEWNAAVASLKKSFELPDGDEEAIDCRFFLAMAYWQLGDKEQAAKSYDEAARLMDKKESLGKRLRRIRAEVTELMGIKVKAKPEKEPARNRAGAS